MVESLSRRKAPDRIALNREHAADEERRVAQAYLVWPLAIAERISARDDASHWYKFHLRQALWFGNALALAWLVALVWPLVLSGLVQDLTATLWIYGVALTLDTALLVLGVIAAVRYSRRAGRGAFFVIPWLARVTGSGSPTP